MALLALLADAATTDAEGVSFPALDTWHYPSQLFWLFISFGGLYFVMSRIVLPRLSNNLERRSDTIADDLDEAAKLNEQAEEAKKELELNLAKARSGARETVAEAEAEMADEIAAETRRADAELETRLEKAETRIQELRTEAMDNVQTVAIEATRAIVEKLGVKTTAAKAKTAVAAALKERR
ncbi:MAG: hypothetical protein AAFY34_05670 [Pseudomonadota bacterium]